MPELPEAERARVQIERVLGREIVAVDDRDTYVCRPHAPGRDRRRAGRRGRLTRRTAAASSCGPRPTTAGPELGLHLGMAGRIVVDEAPRATGARDGGTASRSRSPTAAGSRCATSAGSGACSSSPTSPTSARTPPLVGREEFRARVGRGTAPLKARLLDQGVIAGVGNLLADETLWRARLVTRGARPAR